MSTLYENIILLCKSAGITGGKMCTEIGISKGVLTDLKMGRKQSLSAGTLTKIADYFGVSVDYLLGKENTKKAPAKQEPDDEDIMFALFGEHSEITKEIYEDVKSYARFKMEEAKKKK